MFGARPGHSVKTMTCTSERSGMASSGTWRSDQRPPTVANRMKRMTKNRLWALYSIIRSIMTVPPLELRHGGPHGKLLAQRLLSGSGDCHHEAPGPSHGELRLALIASLTGVGRCRLLNHHPRHVHRVGKTHLRSGDRLVARISHLDADGVLSHLGRLRQGGQRHGKGAHPLVLRDRSLLSAVLHPRHTTLLRAFHTAHLHGFGTFHLPVPHADRAHHAHHALGGLELALRIDEEVSARHDTLTFCESRTHL